MDTVIYVYDSLQTARECGWDKTPTGVMSLVNSSSAPNHDTVAGCTKSHHGIAGGGAAKFEIPYWYGVSGFLPCDTDLGLDSVAAAVAPGQNADADEGSGEGDLVDIDAHPEIYPYGAEVE
eukprot:4290247-Pyramimonas_sp.AAC.1